MAEKISRITVLANKGGVGKTLVAVSLGVCLGRLLPEERVVIVDADPGSRTTSLLLGGSAAPEHDIFDCLNDPMVQPEEVLVRSPLLPNLYIIPNTRGYDLEPALRREKEVPRKKLIQLINHLDGFASFTVFDTPPGKRTLHFFLSLATTCFLVTQPKEDSLRPSHEMLISFEKKSREAKLLDVKNIDYLVINAVTESDDMRKVFEFAAEHGVKIAAIIPWSAAVEESISAWQPLPLFRPDDPAAVALCQLAKKIAGMEDWEDYTLAEKRSPVGGVPGYRRVLDRLGRVLRWKR